MSAEVMDIASGGAEAPTQISSPKGGKEERGYERHISGYICKEIGWVVDWVECADDCSRDSGYSFTNGGRNRCQYFRGLATRCQRMCPPSVCVVHEEHQRSSLELLLGVLYIFIGSYLFMHPSVGLASLTIGLAIYLLVESIPEFVLGFTLRPLPGSGWLLFDGIITLILAVMIWRTWPSSSTWVIGTLVGISMLFSGFSRLMLSLAARTVTTKLA